jgi:hypothetical protein
MMRDGRVLALAVLPGGDVMIEGEHVPGELPAGAQGAGDPLEHPPPVGPRREVQERPVGAVDEARGLGELQIAHVSLAQVERHPGVGGRGAGLGEHGGRGVDPDDGATGGEGHGDGHPAAADGQLDQGPGRVDREADVERHVLRHRCGPLVVAVCERLGPAHGAILGTGG